MNEIKEIGTYGNKADVVLALLGLEIDKPFFLEGDLNEYRIDEALRVEMYDNRTQEFVFSDLYIENFILGQVEIMEMPPKGTQYYFPDYFSEYGYSSKEWMDSDLDYRIFKRVGIYYNPADAQAKFRQIIQLNT